MKNYIFLTSRQLGSSDNLSNSAVSPRFSRSPLSPRFAKPLVSPRFSKTPVSPRCSKPLVSPKLSVFSAVAPSTAWPEKNKSVELKIGPSWSS